MMSERMIDLLDDVWGDIADVCGDLSDDEWGRPTECPGWSVKDNVAHMIGTERMLMGHKPDADPEEPPEFVRNDIGRANQQWVDEYGLLPGNEVLEAFVSVTGQRLDALRALTPEDWEREGFTPEGPGPYRQFMAIRVFDCWYHDQDVREALGRPGYLEGAVADLSLARIGAKALGYVVGKKAGAPPSSTVVFDVLGTPPITVAVAVPPEGRALVVDETPANPTAHITFDRRTYARLAGGRWSGDEARGKGSVSVAGDTELANRVVDNMAFTI
jgi:uncharacterized protein (TIGR03083 family)